SKNAIEKINKKYTEEIYFSNLLSIYEKLLNSKNKGENV
ncbi:hypothetical protein JDF658_25060, partial [Carboxydocella sp. JDF658]